MRRRPVHAHEQPHRLRVGLQEAVLSTFPATTQPARTGGHSPGVPVASPTRRVAVPVGLGVPHGVREAIVYARDMRVAYYDGQPHLFFCESYDFKVVAPTAADGDGGAYPAPGRNFVSASARIPQQSGYYPVRMRVSINGSVAVHIEQIGHRAAREAERLVSANA